MKKINNIKIFSNNNDESHKIEKELLSELSKYNFNVVEENYDLAIAIGGDGSFLRMIKNTIFNSDIYYVGINTGTLGFLQEIKPENIKEFILRLSLNDYKIDNIGVLETKIYTKESLSRYYTLNEIVIREKDLNTCKFEINIDDNRLETFVGDGLLITTSVGSSAYNLSYGGSLIYNTLHTIQLTPIAPLNSKAYRNLLNPIVLPEKLFVNIKPLTNDLLISIDGENKIYNNIIKIECSVRNKKVKFLRMKEYNYINIVNEKFLTDK